MRKETLKITHLKLRKVNPVWGQREWIMSKKIARSRDFRCNETVFRKLEKESYVPRRSCLNGTGALAEH